jgi:hypothetical protein
MANYDTFFSLALTRTPEIGEFLKQRQERADTLSEDDPDEFFEWYAGVTAEDLGTMVLLTGESPEAGIRFVQEYLDFHGMHDQAVVLSWAETCSKPRPGAFGGGMVVISSAEAHHIDPWPEANEWAESKNLKRLNDW